MKKPTYEGCNIAALHFLNQTVMKNLFNTLLIGDKRYNVFDLSHEVKTTCKFGELIPTCCIEVSPGDKIRLGVESITKTAPMIKPPYQRYNQTTHFFYVSFNSLWENWDDYFAGISSPPPAFPYVTLGDEWNAASNKLLNNFGLPNSLDGFSENVSAMALAAYQKICNEFYMDSTLGTPQPYELVDGDNTSNGGLFVLRQRAWGKDYFTSALPNPQRGPDVTIPLGDVVLKDVDQLEPDQPAIIRGADDHGFVTGDVGSIVGAMVVNPGTPEPAVFDPNGTLEVESFTVETLRSSTALQQFYELMSRAGTRVRDIIKAFFNVDTGDARLQMAEYITGVKTPITITETLNQTGTDDLPQGNLSGNGIAYANRGRSGSYFVKEQGLIIGITSVIPDSAYQQGIARMWSKINNREEFFFPQFAHLGEQAILNREIFAFSNVSDQTFGYTPRYAEYKWHPSQVNGDFRTSLSMFVGSRIFSSTPPLNESFVSVNGDGMDINRIWAVNDGTDQLWLYMRNVVIAKRKMPKFGVPSLIS